MKFTPSAFKTDKLTLKPLEVIKLLLGRTLKQGALEVRMAKHG